MMLTVTEYVMSLKLVDVQIQEHVTTVHRLLMMILHVNTFHVQAVQTIHLVTTMQTLLLRMDHACTLLNSTIVTVTA